jgi:Mg-chelatase subunit ChlD
LSYEPSQYFPETVSAFQRLAKANGGELRFASTSVDIVRQIDALLEKQKGKSLDLVLCVDSTESMLAGIEAMKARLPAELAKRAADFPSFRFGLVAFKDYFEEYLYKRFDFTRDINVFSADLESLQSGGGRDIPEAVYEGLYAAASEFPWAAQARVVLLVGDAPPHPLPRGSVDEQAVSEAATSSGVVMDAVAVPR